MAAARVEPLRPPALAQIPDEAERSRRLFTGELLCFARSAAGDALLELARRRLCDALGDPRPSSAHRRLSRTDWLARIGALQRTFAADDEIRAAFRAALAAAGVDPARNAWDRCVLRAVPPGPMQHRARRSFVSPHRDTWGANLPAQVNWWMPLYPLTAARTLQFYPDYWQRPVANSTAEWRYADYLAARRSSDPDRRTDYPSAPAVLASLRGARRRPVLLEPGQWLAFSSAHLHGSVANRSALTRFSVELRSLNLDDLAVGRCAADVDNAGRDGPHYEWFRRIADGAPLRPSAGSGADGE